MASLSAPTSPYTMQSRLSGYSDFFASGFRAILLARDPQPRSTPSTSRLRRLSFSYKRTPAKRSKRDSFIEFSSSLTETLSSKPNDGVSRTQPVSLRRQIEPETPSYENIDPFTSSPDAKSIFVHSFDTTDPPRRSTSKRDSSLSFSPPKPKPKPRPVSMPVPLTRHSWAEETETWTLNLDHFEEEEEDFAHRIDWRQFHVDVLLDE